MKVFLKELLKELIIVLFAGAGLCTAVYWTIKYLKS